MKTEKVKEHIPSSTDEAMGRRHTAKPSPKKALAGVERASLLSNDAIMQFLGDEVETIKLAWSAIDKAIQMERFAGMLPLSEWKRISRVLAKLVLLGMEQQARAEISPPQASIAPSDDGVAKASAPGFDTSSST